jgi:hypothetical protein
MSHLICFIKKLMVKNKKKLNNIKMTELSLQSFSQLLNITHRNFVRFLNSDEAQTTDT